MIVASIRRESKQIYFSMNKIYYYTFTIVIYVIAIVGAIFIDDLGIVFTVSASVTGACVQYLFPSYFYLHAESLFAEPEERARNKKHRILAWFYVFIGFASFFGLMGSALWDIISPSA